MEMPMNKLRDNMLFHDTINKTGSVVAFPGSISWRRSSNPFPCHPRPNIPMRNGKNPG